MRFVEVFDVMGATPVPVDSRSENPVRPVKPLISVKPFEGVEFVLGAVRVLFELKFLKPFEEEDFGKETSQENVSYRLNGIFLNSGRRAGAEAQIWRQN